MPYAPASQLPDQQPPVDLLPSSVTIMECYQTYLVTTYEDGSKDYEPVGSIWCVGTTQQSDEPVGEDGSGSGGGSSDDPSPVLVEPKANICEVWYLVEMAFAGRDPIHAAASMLLNEQNVTRRIKEEFPYFRDTDSEPLNAVKHAMFIAFNACDFGSFDAGNLATLHEDCGGIPPEKQQSAAMDLFNNNVGLSIQAQVGCDDMNALAEAIFNAFRTGKLHKLDGQPTP